MEWTLILFQARAALALGQKIQYLPSSPTAANTLAATLNIYNVKYFTKYLIPIFNVFSYSSKHFSSNIEYLILNQIKY